MSLQFFDESICPSGPSFDHYLSADSDPSFSVTERTPTLFEEAGLATKSYLLEVDQTTVDVAAEFHLNVSRVWPGGDYFRDTIGYESAEMVVPIKHAQAGTDE